MVFLIKHLKQPGDVSLHLSGENRFQQGRHQDNGLVHDKGYIPVNNANELAFTVAISHDL